jgi:hypothetical protein
MVFHPTHAFKFIIRVVPHTHTHTLALLGPLSMLITSTFSVNYSSIRTPINAEKVDDIKPKRLYI